MNDNDLHFVLDSHKANKTFEDWKMNLSRACGISINDESFLNLSQTSRLKNVFFDKIKSGSVSFHIFWSASEQCQLGDYLNHISNLIGTRMAILFNSQDRYYGAIRLPIETVTRNLFAIWQVVEEDIAMATEDMESGLCIEKGFYNKVGEYEKEGTYELTAWGLFAQ